MTESVDPYHLLRVLEDVTDKHARTVRALERTLRRLRRDLGNEALQSLALTQIKRLRVLRRRLLRELGEGANLGSAEAEILKNVATLSEYMVIVGYIYEEEVLRKALILAKRGARLLAEEMANIEADLDEIARLTTLFQQIVDKYY